MYRTRSLIHYSSKVLLCALFLAPYSSTGAHGAADIEFRLSNGEYGEVEVCWNGTWMGVSDFSVRTTRQANAICKALNHSHEGAEILDAVDKASNVTCFWEMENETTFISNCFHNTSCYDISLLNKTAAIKCQSMFGPTTIALMSVVPFLSLVILVGLIILIHFIRKAKRLNVIIHQLIIKQQKIKAMLQRSNISLEDSIRTSMYAKPIINGSSSKIEDTEEEGRERSSVRGTGVSQYSELGHESLEIFDLKKINAHS